MSTEPTPSGMGWDDLLDGRYRAAEEIGRGAMGVVYVAEHTRLAKRVAIKVLHADLAEDAETCGRFELEARAASRVGSPHIVDVVDAGALQDGRRFLVMEYLRGETLKAWLERLAPVTAERLAPLVLQLCEGLAAAHDQGIVHRDVKPDNLFLVKRAGADPLVKILDFGVSKFRDHGTDALRSRTGIVLGTPHYMAPEQARGEREVDRRADLYSVGIIMYQALCGERPFAADNVNQLLFRVALEDVPRIDEVVPSVPPAFADIVMKATARDPDRRYGSARLLARDVQRWIDGNQPATSSGPTTAVALAVDLDAPTAGDEEPVMPESTRVEPVAPVPTRRAWWTLGAVALALALALAVVTRGGDGDEAVAPTDSAAVVTPPAVTASMEPGAAEMAPTSSAVDDAPVPEPQPPVSKTAPPLPRPPAAQPPAPAAQPPPATPPPATPPPTAKTPRPIREAL